jgi:hypothetical protein
MKGLRRFVGLIVLLLATVGFVGCIAGIVGIWTFRQKATAKVEDISARVEVGLKRVSVANLKVKNALKKARAEVAKVNMEANQLDADNPKQRLTTHFLRDFIRKNVGPNINDLGDRLTTVSDAALAVSSLLQSFEELPLAQSSRFDPDKVKRLAEVAAQLPEPLRKLEAVIGEGDDEPTAGDVGAAANEVDVVLQRCQATVNEWETDVDAAAQGVPRMEDEILTWLMRAAILVTVVGAWMALGQLSLLVHGWKWCRGD